MSLHLHQVSAHISIRFITPTLPYVDASHKTSFLRMYVTQSRRCTRDETFELNFLISMQIKV